jgi:hypothetical protein
VASVAVPTEDDAARDPAVDRRDSRLGSAAALIMIALLALCVAALGALSLAYK